MVEHHIMSLEQESESLRQELILLQQHQHNLEQTLASLRQAKAFRLWQLANDLKSVLVHILRNPKQGVRLLQVIWQSDQIFTEQLTRNSFANYSKEIIDHEYQQWLTNNKMESLLNQLSELAKKQQNQIPSFDLVLPTMLYTTDSFAKVLEAIKQQSYAKFTVYVLVAKQDQKHEKVARSYAQNSNLVQIVTINKKTDIMARINELIVRSSSQYIGFLFQEAIVSPKLLKEIARNIEAHGEAELIYTDEDYIENDLHLDPFFKPDYSPDLLLSYNYFGNLVFYRTATLRDMGRLDSSLLQYKGYDLSLRVVEIAKKVFHIPVIGFSNLGKGQITNNFENNKQVVTQALARRGYAAIIKQGKYHNSLDIIYQLRTQPLVSIIIPTKDKADLLKKCVDGIYRDGYQNFELIIISNNSTEQATFDYFNSLKKDKRVRVIEFNEPFNISRIFNFAVAKAIGEYILLLNNDIESITKDWITRMIAGMQRKNVGGIGVKLLYPNQTIQHAGVILGLKSRYDEVGVAGHCFSTMVDEDPALLPRYFLKDITRNFSAVTGACFITTKRQYEEVGGFNDKDLRVLFSDVDFCLKLRGCGYDIVYDPTVVMYHHEHVSIGRTEEGRKIDKAEINYMEQAWGSLLANDPYYNRNLSVIAPGFHIETNNIKSIALITSAPESYRTMARGLRIIRKDGIRGIVRKLKTKSQVGVGVQSYNDQYKQWMEKIENPALKQAKLEAQKLPQKQKISVLMPTYNSETAWLNDAIASLNNQFYTNWELCIADDCSTSKQTIDFLKNITNPKIKITFRKSNGGIATATNDALALATGQYIALLDHDDELAPQALSEVVKLIEQYPDADMIYSDEDKLDENGNRCDPFFKPGWAPDYLLSSMYTAHLSVYRTSLVKKLGGFRKELHGSQDYDLALRVTEQTKNIYHIPQILYHWRKVAGSTAAVYTAKTYAKNTAQKAIEDAIQRRKLNATVEGGIRPDLFRLRYAIKKNPLVSIIVPTRNKKEVLEVCVKSVLQKTSYTNYELVIVDNQSNEPETLAYFKELKKSPKITILSYDKPFNFAAINNFAAKKVKGEYIVLLNNDTEVIAPGWLEAMLEHAQRKEVGAVGAKLLYPTGKIQHAGVILGIGGVAGHVQKMFADDEPAALPIFNAKDLIRNWSGVTAACLMMNKAKYLALGGLDETFVVAWNDVDFCIRAMKKGYYNVYTPYAKLYHHESISVGRPESGNRDLTRLDQETARMKQQWNELLQNDPFYNPNLSLEREDFSLRI